MYDLVIKEVDGESITIDLGPVNDYVRYVEAGDTVSELDTLKLLSQYQLQYAATILSGKVKELRRLNTFLQTKAGMAATNKLHEFRQLARKAGHDLWPELGD